MSNEDIKMSASFALPLKKSMMGICDEDRKIHEGFRTNNQDNFAILAINNHDQMALQIKELEAALLEVLNTCEVDYAIGKGRHGELMNIINGESK